MYRSLNHYRILNKLSNEKLLRSCACIIRTKVNFHCNIRYSSEMFETWKERKELAETEGWWFAILSGYLLFKYLKWWNISKRHRYHTRANRRMRKAFESHKGTCRRQFVAFCSTVRFQRLPNNVLLALGIDERIEDILLLPCCTFEGIHRWRGWIIAPFKIGNYKIYYHSWKTSFTNLKDSVIKSCFGRKVFHDIMKFTRGDLLNLFYINFNRIYSC